jgi:hypothetical protein
MTLQFLKFLTPAIIVVGIVAPLAAAPQTLGDWIGWTVAIVIFLLLVGITLGVWVSLWRRLFGEQGTSIFLFRPGRNDAPIVPMLLICGDEAFCEDDELQLRRARIMFRKLEHATLNDVDKEFQRRRLDGTLYKWVHISAHGTANGFVLTNDLMTADWLADRIDGIEIVFAASCDSASVGDALAGIADAVIVVYGKRGSGLISTFACAFWREVAMHNDARRAYRTALREVPQLGPYVDLRIR